MKKGTSVHRKINRGRIKAVWNTAVSRTEFYLRGSRGFWLLCNPFTGAILEKGPGMTTHKINQFKTK